MRTALQGQTIASEAARTTTPRVRNRTTPQGRELGAMFAKFCDDAEPKARLRMPELPPRCNSCAFRQGNHLANGSPATQSDAIKCVIEGIEFHCHEPAREGWLCTGWAMFMLALDDPEQLGKAPWDFIGGVETPKTEPTPVTDGSVPQRRLSSPDPNRKEATGS